MNSFFCTLKTADCDERERERSSVMSVIAPRRQFIRPSLSPFNENNSYVFVHSISIILRENLPTRSMMLQLRSLSFAGTDGEPARERDMFTSAGKMEPISEKPSVKFGYRPFFCFCTGFRKSTFQRLCEIAGSRNVCQSPSDLCGNVPAKF